MKQHVYFVHIQYRNSGSKLVKVSSVSPLSPSDMLTFVEEAHDVDRRVDSVTMFDEMEIEYSFVS